MTDNTFEPKINYELFEENSKELQEFKSTIHDAILSIDEQQKAMVKQLEQQAVDSNEKHKQIMRWTKITALIAVLTLISEFFTNLYL